MTPEERQAALERVRQGDTLAWGELLESFRPYLLCIARTRGCENLLGKVGESDLIQEALLQAHRDFGAFRGTTVEELAAWLGQIVSRATGHALRNHLGTAKRDRGREQPLAGMSSMLPGSASSPSRQAIRHEQAARMAEAVSRLPEDMQQVILGRHVDNLPYAELAEQMRLSEGAVRVLYTRAIRRLRDECAESDDNIRRG